MTYDATRANTVETQASPPIIFQELGAAPLGLFVPEGEGEFVGDWTGIGAVTFPFVFCLENRVNVRTKPRATRREGGIRSLT